MIFIKRKTLKNLLVILIIIGVIYFFNIPNEMQRTIYKKEYSESVQKYATKYNVDENLIYAVIKAESNFNSNAKSSKGAIGLMQLMETTAIDEINITKENISKKLLEADTNINLGTKYLSILVEKYNNIELAISAYNAGTGTVDNWVRDGVIKDDGSDIENIPYKETNNYVRRILRDYKIYQSLY